MNTVFRMKDHPREPAFDWLTFNDLQATMDKTLQESVAFYDPARLVTIFVYLPSQSGKSVAIWRRKVNVPDSTRLKYQAEINAIVKTLRDAKDYVVMVDEFPAATNKARTATRSDRKCAAPIKAKESLPTCTTTSKQSEVDKAAVLEYLQSILEAPIDEWKKAITVMDVLERHLAVQTALKTLSDLGWDSRASGGYKIPQG